MASAVYQKCKLLFMVLALCLSTLVAYAQSEIDVRFSSKSDFDRFVFEMSSGLSYTAEESNDSLMLKFNREMSADLSGIDSKKFNYTASINVDKKSISLKGNLGTKFKDFKIGRKVIVDVRGDKVDQASVINNQRNKADTNAKAKASSTNRAEQVKSKTVTSSEPLPTLITKTSTLPANTKKEGIITVSSTQSFGMAGFIDNGYLWLIADKPDMKIVPQVKGSAAKWLGDPNVISASAATIFQYRWPFLDQKNLIDVQGGGLLWRFIIGEEQDDFSQGDMRSYKNDDGKAVVFVETGNVNKIISYKDPLLNKKRYVATTTSTAIKFNDDRSFLQFDISDAFLGAIVLDHVAALSVAKDPQKDGRILIQAEKGIQLSEQAFEFYNAPSENLKKKPKEAEGRIYNFSAWKSNGIEELDINRRKFEEKLSSIEPTDPVYAETIINLAKLHLGNYLPHEALGYFNFAEKSLEDLKDNPEFMALRAAAKALANRNLEAERDFLNPVLKDIPEINFWLSYNNGRLERWDKASKLLPEDERFVSIYPKPLAYEMALMSAETALRQQNKATAEKYLDFVEIRLEDLHDPYLSSYRYLKGELERQQGNDEVALELWKSLLEQGDKLHRAKAGLAWAKLSLQRDDITAEKAIDILEQIRFTWRGDGLETQINHELGLVYVQDKNYKKGLSILRETASNIANDGDRVDIVKDMQNIFSDLFIGDPAEELTAIQSVTLYEAFSELLPAGAEGNQIMQALISKLIDVDLLDRASAFLTQLINTRLDGLEKLKAQIKLARVKLNSKEEQETINILDQVDDKLLRQNGKLFKEKIITEVKALSEIGQVAKAFDRLELLGDEPEVYQLRADIAWSNERWNDAANALLVLASKKGLLKKEKLDNEEAKLILNTAVAINLSNNLQRLQNFQRQFENQMKETPFGRLFKIVTRPPGTSFLTSRETIMQIVDEVDLFQGILEQF